VAAQEGQHLAALADDLTANARLLERQASARPAVVIAECGRNDSDMARIGESHHAWEVRQAPRHSYRERGSAQKL
jgi:hypothetical protein